jgi:hypothetical protein
LCQAKVQAFMKQPKLQFTIDCLVEEFAKFSAAGVPLLSFQRCLLVLSMLKHFCAALVTQGPYARTRNAPDAGGATAAAKPKGKPRRKPNANGAPAGQAAADGE